MTEVHLSLKNVLSAFRVQPRDYQKECIGQIVSALVANDVALQLPTGTGKSYVYLPLAIAAASSECRVCILCPTNLIITQVKDKYLPDFKAKTQLIEVKGIEHYDCPLSGKKADYITCSREQRKACNADGMECNVLKYRKIFEEHSFIITNFHKFLSTPIENKFDLVIIDDSHGFENVIDNKFQTAITYFRVEDVYRRHENRKDRVADLTGSFLDLMDEIVGAMPPNQLKRRVADDDVKRIGEIEQPDALENEMKSLDPVEMGICYELRYFVECCKDPTLNRFYVQKDYYHRDDFREAVLTARKSDVYIQNVIRSIFAESRVMFTSAFLGNITKHAHYCTRREYDGNKVVLVPNEKLEIIKKWFDTLYIYDVQDLTANEGDPFDEGIELISEMLHKCHTKSLLLFKNYRNQRRAQNILEREIKRSRVKYKNDCECKKRRGSFRGNFRIYR